MRLAEKFSKVRVKIHGRQGRVCLLGLALLLLLVGAAAAQSDVYSLPWSSVDGGGAVLASGGGYTLSGAAGQFDAGLLEGSGGYALSGGFWPGSSSITTIPTYKVFLPMERNRR